jgi:DegV family protein with EDD domain
MNLERKVRVVTDSGSSMRPEYEEAKESGITIIPLEVVFTADGQSATYSDFEISPEEFYRKMSQAKELPTTSGAIESKAHQVYQALSRKTNGIVSIHITSQHSAAWETAYLPAEAAKKDIPELSIEVIDSKQASLGVWFLAEMAAKLSQEGASLEEIKQEVLENIPKVQLLATLSTLDNVIKGGRVPALAGYAAKILDIKPIIGIEDGLLREFGRGRTVNKARRNMISMVKDEVEIVRMAVVHTNDPEAAGEVKEALGEFYKGKIPIYEAGPVLGVHAGEGAVGIIFQRP